MVKKLQALRAKKGFTLVELIVVIAIIGVLAAILVPVMMGQVTKAKINSLDSTASTVVTTVNTWIADRYTHGESGSINGNYVAKGGTITKKDGAAATLVATKWNALGQASDDTSLSFAIHDAYNFAADDYIKFWIIDGKCAAAAFVQGDSNASDLDAVGYNGAWSALKLTNAKDAIVNLKADGSGAMVGTSPKQKTATSTPAST